MRDEATAVSMTILMAFACLQVTLYGVFLAESPVLPVFATIVTVAIVVAMTWYSDEDEPVAGAESGQQNSQMTDTDSTGGIAAK